MSEQVVLYHIGNYTLKIHVMEQQWLLMIFLTQSIIQPHRQETNLSRHVKWLLIP